MRKLEKLKITNRVMPLGQPRRRSDSTEYRLQKLISNIEEQIQLARRANEGKPLTLDRKRGHLIKTVRPRLWWKETPNEGVFAQVWYNKIPLKLDGRGTTIEVTSIKKLPSAYRAVVEAIKRGELDQEIDRVLLRNNL